MIREAFLHGARKYLYLVLEPILSLLMLLLKMLDLFFKALDLFFEGLNLIFKGLDLLLVLLLVTYLFFL